MRSLLLLPLLAALLPACQDGPYSAPPGQFFCSQTYCETDTQFCVLGPGVDGGGPTAGCAPASSACADGIPSCACAASLCTGTGGSCQRAADGSVTVSCPM